MKKIEYKTTSFHVISERSDIFLVGHNYTQWRSKGQIFCAFGNQYLGKKACKQFQYKVLERGII